MPRIRAISGAARLRATRGCRTLRRIRRVRTRPPCRMPGPPRSRPGVPDPSREDGANAALRPSMIHRRSTRNESRKRSSIQQSAVLLPEARPAGHRHEICQMYSYLRSPFTTGPHAYVRVNPSRLMPGCWRWLRRAARSWLPAERTCGFKECPLATHSGRYGRVCFRPNFPNYF